MSIVSISLPTDGTTADVADYNTPLTALANDHNGNIDNSNIAAAAAIAGSKMADASVLPVKLANAYRFAAYRATTQNVGTAATKVQFDTEFYDPNSNYDNATNYRYTAPVTGIYHFNANVSTTTAGSGTSVLILLYVNGSEVRRGPRNEASAGQAPGVALSTDVALTAADYVEIFVSTGTAAKALDASGTGYNTFSGHLVVQTA